MIGVSHLYREHSLDAETTVGRALLHGVLEHIAHGVADGRMPGVWGYVAPSNEKSLRMFKWEGFSYHPPIRDGADGFVYRPARLPL